MSEFYCIIPDSKRPYEWAYQEMTENFPNPEKFRVVDLDQLKFEPGVHMSFFHTEEQGKPNIIRVYWADTDSVKYSILLNYYELLSRHESIVKMLESNGRAAYDSELRKVHKTITYDPLRPIKIG